MKFLLKLQAQAPRGLVAAAVTLCSLAAVAADGLQPPAADTLWPHWQARLSLQSSSLSMLTASRLLDGGTAPRAIQGAALLGDYYFTSPEAGGFRASGGLMFGLQGTVSLSSGTSLLPSGAGMGLQPAGSGLDLGAASTYLGLGFSGSLWRNSLALTADLGLRTERLGWSSTTTRALLGSQGADFLLRELRVTPLLQLGLRYSF